ncbi:MAG: Mce-associated rane protein [Mycobacterium sp.]|jgi:Mce-associated membrane protein|nr:Mce-associated rane protein [Mycobacterium sp.]
MAVNAASPTGKLSELATPLGDADPSSAERTSSVEQPERSPVDVADANDVTVNTEGVGDADSEREPRRQPKSPVRLATLLGVIFVFALAGLSGWLGHRTYQSHRAQHQGELFVEVARQEALNLTTIDWQHAEADAQRILDSATGTFYDDFSKRTQPFIDVVKQAQSKSVGTIAEAGVESVSANEAQVLVAVTVRTSSAPGAQQEPRGWRMRMTVQEAGHEVKVSNVAFVP